MKLELAEALTKLGFFRMHDDKFIRDDGNVIVRLQTVNRENGKIAELVSVYEHLDDADIAAYDEMECLCFNYRYYNPNEVVELLGRLSVIDSEHNPWK